ncbi:MAG: hypothetical protein ABL971_13400 [Vicinamibacterales bacterium]
MRLAQIVSMMVLTAAVSAQGPSPQQLFESGQHEQALQEVAAQRERGMDTLDVAFLEGLVLLKMEQTDGARQAFARLVMSAEPGWASVGESGIALLDSGKDAAREAANRAVEAAPELFQAHYQLGVAAAQFQDWAACAEAFRRAAELEPSFAYAHYFAGLSFSRIGRADRTSEHFERFLRLAPRAPERAAVETLMRTLRGR